MMVLGGCRVVSAETKSLSHRQSQRSTISGIRCTNRWTNIKNQFRRYLQKRNSEAELRDTVLRKKYKREDHFHLEELLLPYSNGRRAMSSRSDVGTGELYDEERRVGRRSRAASAPKYLLEENESSLREDPVHDMDAFLAGIAPALKKLTQHNQHVAKGRIFNLIHDLEAQEMLGQLPQASSATCQDVQDLAAPSGSQGQPSGDGSLKVPEEPSGENDAMVREYFNMYS